MIRYIYKHYTFLFIAKSSTKKLPWHKRSCKLTTSLMHSDSNFKTRKIYSAQAAIPRFCLRICARYPVGRPIKTNFVSWFSQQSVRLIIFNIHKKINGRDMDDAAASFQKLNTCNMELHLISDGNRQPPRYRIVVCVCMMFVFITNMEKLWCANVATE